MTNQEILNLNQGLYSVGNLVGPNNKFAYAVAKNIMLLRPYLGEIESLRIKLCERLAKKDDNGKPIVEKDQYVFENKELYDKEWKNLMEGGENIKIHKV